MTRSDFLKEYSPDTYNEMKKNGTLDEHSNAATENVNEMVDKAIDKAIASPEYAEAQANGDFAKMQSIVETEKMFTRHEAERMYIYSIDDEAKEALDAFNNTVYYWSYDVHYGNAPFENYRYDYDTKQFECIFKDGLDQWDNEIPPVDEIIAERDVVYDELVSVLFRIDPTKRYKLYEYLNCIFDRYDPCTQVLKDKVIAETADMDDDEPMKKIIGFYLNDDEEGLLDYVKYRDISR